MTSPAPSWLAGRVSSRTTCGWRGRSSAESSARTMRSPGGTRPSRQLSSVVLPEPVPPETRYDRRASSTARRRAAVPPSMLPAAISSSRVKARVRTTRRDRHGAPTTTGGSTACSLVPSGSRASTQGRASSRRRPAAEASRWASLRTAAASANRTSVRSSPAPRSAHTSSGPFTRTSVTSGSASSPSRGPAPTISERRAATTSSTSVSPSSRPCARNAAATPAGVGSSPEAASRRRTASSRAGVITSALMRPRSRHRAAPR